MHNRNPEVRSNMCKKTVQRLETETAKLMAKTQSQVSRAYHHSSNNLRTYYWSTSAVVDVVPACECLNTKLQAVQRQCMRVHNLHAKVSCGN